MVNYLII